ncbi:hypothetical protein [Streptomyces sp. BE20]|uniref:hypothetical protein n=1 Tax=Streptomyces sp. BE20 TaxID=3002525 RepID=UPI002E79A5DD|nr:hypothetical protein [Streptomyces sp. BE20]
MLRVLEQYRVRRLPVINHPEHELVGMISEAEIARSLPQARLAEFVAVRSRGGITSRPRGFCGSCRAITKVSERNRWTARVCSCGVTRSVSTSPGVKSTSGSRGPPTPSVRLVESWPTTSRVPPGATAAASWWP